MARQVIVWDHEAVTFDDTTLGPVIRRFGDPVLFAAMVTHAPVGVVAKVAVSHVGVAVTGTAAIEPNGCTMFNLN